MRVSHLLGAAALIAVPGLALARVSVPPDITVDVPEIDALSGLGAMAAVGGIAALVWERRRNRDD